MLVHDISLRSSFISDIRFYSHTPQGQTAKSQTQYRMTKKLEHVSAKLSDLLEKQQQDPSKPIYKRKWNVVIDDPRHDIDVMTNANKSTDVAESDDPDVKQEPVDYSPIIKQIRFRRYVRKMYKYMRRLKHKRRHHYGSEYHHYKKQSRRRRIARCYS